MNSIARYTAVIIASLTFAVPAFAHCGSCGVGGEKDTQEECTSKCADEGDDSTCVQQCLEKHETDHEKEANAE
ncbi:MAG: hypothetical protein P8R42_21045 [Candidatus Binatia bacterium]|nr:hypothetical protein [Candidatus Binatia bacterium]